MVVAVILSLLAVCVAFGAYIVGYQNGRSDGYHKRADEEISGRRRNFNQV